MKNVITRHLCVPIFLLECCQYIKLQKISYCTFSPAFKLDLPLIVADGLKVNFHGVRANLNPVVEGKKRAITVAENVVEKQCLEAAEVFCFPVK